MYTLAVVTTSHGIALPGFGISGQMLLGLDKLFLFSYLLFYSHILKNFTYYSFQATHYLYIILNYSSILMAESGQNHRHILHFYTVTKH